MSSQIIYKQGEATVVVPATESVAIYSKDKADVYQVVVYPDRPDTKAKIGTVSDGQTVFGAYASGTTLVIEANAANVLYTVGVAPVVLEDDAKAVVVTAVDVTGAVTATAILGGIVTSAAATVAGTVPTGTVLDAASEFAIGESFKWSVIKVGANAFTVTAAAGHTLVGVAVVATATSGAFETVKTAANTFVTYRIG